MTNCLIAPLGRLFVLPGSRFKALEFSWKFEVAPGGIGFVVGRGLATRRVLYARLSGRTAPGVAKQQDLGVPGRLAILVPARGRGSSAAAAAFLRAAVTKSETPRSP